MHTGKGSAQKLPATRSSPRNVSPLDLKGQRSPTAGTPSPNRPSLHSPNALSDPNSLKKKIKKSGCPCGRSSAGKDWVVVCSDNNCKQSWHSSCGNLKGANCLNQAQVENLTKQWQCPWCFVAPYTKPASHPSAVNESCLLEKALSCTMIQNITDSVKESIKNSSSTVDISGLEARLADLTKEIKDFKESSTLTIPQARTPVPRLSTPIHKEKVLECQEKPYETIKENFLANDEMAYVTDLLGYLKDSADFVLERGHSVKMYGEPYSYTFFIKYIKIFSNYTEQQSMKK
jgi:hypothetical protein